MKKILVITSNLNPNTGWGRYSLEITERLKSKYNLHILTEQGSQGNLRKPENIFIFVKNVFIVRKLARDCEIVHCFDAWPYAIYGYFAVVGTDKKLFVNAVGTYSIAPLDSGAFRKFLLRRAYQKASQVFAISSYTKRELEKRVEGVKTQLVHLGTTKLLEPDEKDRDLVKNKIQSRSPVILTVGALKWRKGQHTTLEAVNELKKIYPNILYVVIGDDSDKEYVKKMESLSDGNLFVAGKISDKELSTWYESADVFALNSINYLGNFEGFGLVFLEGYQFGLPAVGSRDCGIEDAISEGETGYLSKQKDIKDISDKIKKILETGKATYAQRCKDFAKKFNWDTTVNTYSSLYERD